MNRTGEGARRLEGPARALSLALASAVLLTALGACARDGNAQTRAAATVVTRDDTASLSRLLHVVRGSDPVLCEMAVRNVDMNGWWSSWGSSNGGPLETDSTAAALIAWIPKKHNDPAVVPRLRTALRDSDGCVRRVAGSMLGRVEHPSAVAALVAALDDASADTRGVAAIGLGLASNERGTAGIDPLIRLLRDESAPVRRAAAWALGSIEAAAAMTPLIDILGRDPDARVRQAAAWALGQLKN